MKLAVLITPRSDLSPDQCRELANAIKRFYGFIDEIDEQAMADLEAGELPRPYALRFIAMAAKDPMFAGLDLAAAQATVPRSLGDRASSRCFALVITNKCVDRARADWWPELVKLERSGLTESVVFDGGLI